ncbi:MAG: cytochrome c biogenesis protein CcdA [Chloroflexi bacterium]|nr:cytochrome c biogenesis protein CcdA [Chloroflexota bacterium]
MELTLAAAVIAGIVSFLSPCVLPVVPAYLGQLGVVAVAALPVAASSTISGMTPLAATVTPAGPSVATPAGPTWGTSRGWRTLPSAIAFVVGFGTVFTVFGVTVYQAAGPLFENLPVLRQVGGLILVLLGLNLMGVLRISRLAGSWRPFDRPFRTRGPRRSGILGGLTLGGIFAVGWTPCIGPTLGAILTLSSQLGTTVEVVALLVAYSLGLGVPFVILALAVDRAPAITGPLVRHGRTMEIVGGALVVVIGLAITFDWLAFLYRTFSFLVPQV